MNQEILLVGSGYMGIEYAKVLNDMKKDFLVIGRGENSANEFFKKTGKKVIIGGFENFIIESNDKVYEKAIVAVGEQEVKSVVEQLLDIGIKEILVEKPAGLNAIEIKYLAQKSLGEKANVYVGYNRRFYSSVLKAKELIEEDGGVKSFNFEFTEWSHTISPLNIPMPVKNNWFLANSTHVIDMAFFMGGKPKNITCFSDKGNLSWHDISIFAGAGITEKGSLFSYQANWEAPGRWSVEMLTNKRRFIFRPLEKLQIQNIGSVALEFVDIDDKIDIDFKPGIYRQTKAFLNGDKTNFCMIENQAENVDLYEKIRKGIGV